MGGGPEVTQGFLFSEDTPGPGHYKLPESMAQKDRCPSARRPSASDQDFLGPHG